MTISHQVKTAIESQGRKKNWIASELGISRPNLDKRLSDNFWTQGQIEVLRLLGLVK